MKGFEEKSREKLKFSSISIFFLNGNAQNIEVLCKKSSISFISDCNGTPLNAFILRGWNGAHSDGFMCHTRRTPSISTNFTANWIIVCFFVCVCIIQCLTDWHPNELKIRKESTNNSRGIPTKSEKRRKRAAHSSSYECIYFFFVLLLAHSSHSAVYVSVCTKRRREEKKKKKDRKKYRVKKYGRKWSIEETKICI